MSVHFVPPGVLDTWGPVVTRIVCCGNRDVGSVRMAEVGARLPRGARAIAGTAQLHVAVTSRRWRKGIIDRGPEDERGRMPDVWDVVPLDELTDTETWCRRHGWVPVPAAAVHAKARAGRTDHPTTVRLTR